MELSSFLEAVNECSISIQPKFEQDRCRSWGEGKREMRGSMEDERIAEKLRDPDFYYQNEKKLQRLY